MTVPASPSACWTARAAPTAPSIPCGPTRGRGRRLMGAAAVPGRAPPGEEKGHKPPGAAVVRRPREAGVLLHAERSARGGGLGIVQVRRPPADLGEDRAVGAERVRDE